MRYIARSTRRRRPIAFSVLLAFAVQSLVPFGYMPKAFADGGFVELCPQGISDEVMAILHADHDFGHNDQDKHDHASMDHSDHQPAHASHHQTKPENSHHSAVHHDHHGHHQHHHYDATTIVESVVHKSVSHEAHSASWQNDCPYGLVVSGTDLAPGFGLALSIEHRSGYQPASLISREIVARLQRNQQPRAPPISINS